VDRNKQQAKIAESILTPPAVPASPGQGSGTYTELSAATTAWPRGIYEEGLNAKKAQSEAATARENRHIREHALELLESASLPETPAKRPLLRNHPGRIGMAGRWGCS